MKRLGELILAGMFLVIPRPDAAAAEPKPSGPSSPRIVRMEILVPEGRWVKVAVPEGEAATVQDATSDLRFAFVPALLGSGIRVQLFQLTKGARGEDRSVWVEDLQSEGDSDAVLYTKRGPASIAVRLLDAGEPAAEAAALEPPRKQLCRSAAGSTSTGPGADLPFLKAGGGGCCVKCGGTTTCGCAAEDWCGSCCSGSCCGPWKV